MAGESLIVVDGAIRFLPDGSLVTDKNGAPCCCGGIKGCCYCVDDLDEGPPPCIHFPPTCNQARICCCGSKMRATMQKDIHLKAGVLERFVLQRDVYEVELKVSPQGNCYTELTFISAYSHRYGTFANGNPYDIEDEQQDPDIFSFFNHFRGELCRPEPKMIFASITNDPGQQVHDALFGGQCSGTAGNNTWNSGGACKTGFFEFHAGSNFPDTFTDERVELTLVTLEDKCCGDPGITPVPGLPDLNPPGGNPGAPGAVGDGDCPRGCGGSIRSDGKCGGCGWCGGCGG